jgi:hypothetical protein
MTSNEIDEIIVHLRDFKQWYYDILFIEVMFSDGETTEPNFEEIIIPFDDTSREPHPTELGRLKVSEYITKNIGEMIEKEIHQKIDLNLIEYEVSDNVPDTD